MIVPWLVCALGRNPFKKKPRPTQSNLQMQKEDVKHVEETPIEDERISEASTTQERTFYSDSWEHICDELIRLNLLIRRQRLLHSGSWSPNAFDQLQGLVLSEEEMNSLFSSLSGAKHNDAESIAKKVHVERLTQELNKVDALIKRRKAESLKKGIYLSLDRLRQIFNLDPFEERILIICLAPEVDRKYEKIYAYLQDDVTRKKPSIDLVLKLLCTDDREKLAARMLFDLQAPLLKFRLVQFSDGSSENSVPLLFRILKLDDRIVNFLLTTEQFDSRLESFAQMILPHSRHENRSPVGEFRYSIADFIRWNSNRETGGGSNLIFYLYGPAGSGKRNTAQMVCRDLEIPLIIGDMAKLMDDPSQFEILTFLLAREAALQPAALCLENFENILSYSEKSPHLLRILKGAIQNFSRVTFLLGNQPWRFDPSLLGEAFIDFEIKLVDSQVRKELWQSYFPNSAELPIGIDFGDLASKFRFTPGQIESVYLRAQQVARWRQPESGQITAADLYAACRSESNQKLSSLTTKMNPKFQWDDIVLPSDQLDQLREICTQARFRNMVYGEWGFGRKLSLGKGLNVMFSGPSGTGKTMAAEIIATELSLDIYKIDLSQVVSKYIGETEKNLGKIFTEAESSNAILFFDEADALFGKRSEVKDAHDRYANIEIGYLLQKMEEYDGIAILATNLRQYMDEAFVRRIQIIVEFPFPDEGSRRRIWRVVFPPEAPRGNDVDLDLLAREVKMAGGNIKNIAVSASFYAAENGQVIRMKHLMRAVRREYQKLGRVWGEVDWYNKITSN